MFLLVFGVVIFAALSVGAMAFVLMILIPGRRAEALTVAAWFAAMGVSLCGWMAGGLGLLVVNGLAQTYLPAQGRVRIMRDLLTSSVFCWTYGVLGLLGCVALATLMAWAHRAIVGRMTLALFRVYAAVVVAGIGSVHGWVLGGVLLHRTPGLSKWIAFLLWGLQMLVLAGTFGYFGFRYAGQLRERCPGGWNLVSAEEFGGGL